MTSFVVLTGDREVLNGKTHPSRIAAMRWAEEITGGSWNELAEAGYNIRRIAGVRRRPRLMAIEIELPEDVFCDLELQAAVVGMPAANLASLLVGAGLTRKRGGH